jgi:hypothetical protein
MAGSGAKDCNCRFSKSVSSSNPLTGCNTVRLSPCHPDYVSNPRHFLPRLGGPPCGSDGRSRFGAKVVWHESETGTTVLILHNTRPHRCRLVDLRLYHHKRTGSSVTALSFSSPGLSALQPIAQRAVGPQLAARLGIVFKLNGAPRGSTADRPNSVAPTHQTGRDTSQAAVR